MLEVAAPRRSLNAMRLDLDEYTTRIDFVNELFYRSDLLPTYLPSVS